MAVPGHWAETPAAAPSASRGAWVWPVPRVDSCGPEMLSPTHTAIARAHREVQEHLADRRGQLGTRV
jgi:hypothetical protein